MVNSAFTARLWITLKKSAGRELKTINHVLTANDNSIGQKSITLKRTAVLKQIIPIMELLHLWQFFRNERNPHESFQCHSSTDFKFVYSFHRNVQ
jgi:hypothetical protein